MLVALRHLRRPLPAAILAVAAVCLLWIFFGLDTPVYISRLSAERPPLSRQYWELEDFGVRSYMFAGSALDGQPVVIRAWLKAVRGGDGRVQLRAVLCGEPLVRNASEAANGEDPCMQSAACQFPEEALRPGFLHMVGWHSRRMHQFTDGRAGHVEPWRQSAPLTLHLELHAAEALAQLFQLRLEGWRKFHAVAVKDLLHASELRAPRLRPAHGLLAAALRDKSPTPTDFYIVNTRLLTPSRTDGDGTTVNQTAAAGALARRVHYHVAMGVDAVWQFGGLELRQRLGSDADVAALQRNGRLQWVSDDIGIPHGSDPRCAATGDTATAKRPSQPPAGSMAEADAAAGSLMGALAELQHWNGERSCTLVAILSGDDCLQLSGGDIRRAAAACLSDGQTSFTLTPSDAADATSVNKATGRIVQLGCGIFNASIDVPTLNGSSTGTDSCAVRVAACARAA